MHARLLKDRHTDTYITLILYSETLVKQKLRNIGSITNGRNVYTKAGNYLVELRINNLVTVSTNTDYSLVSVGHGRTGLIGDFGYNVDRSEVKAESYPVD